MDFIAAIKSGFRQYGTFRGTATRSEYWFWVLFIVLSLIVLSIIESAIWPPMGGAMMSGYYMDPQVMEPPMSGNSPLSDIFGLAVLVPTLAVTVRRFHDAGFSGKWLWLQAGTLLLGLIGMMGFGIALYSGATGMFPGFGLDPYTFMFALLSALAPALLYGLGYSIFQTIVTLRPSKSVEAGNKYGAPAAQATSVAATAPAADAAPEPTDVVEAVEVASPEGAPAKPAAKRKAAPKKAAPSDD